MNLAYNLFLLTLNLSKLHEREKIIQLFTEGLDEIFKPLKFKYSENKPENPESFEIRTGKSFFGLISTTLLQTDSDEQRILINNSVQMLAIILEHLEFERKLEKERNSFEEISISKLREVELNLKELKESRSASINLIEDLTDEIEKRKSAEANLKETQLILKATLESPVDMLILAVDMNYNYLSFNNTHKAVMKVAYGTDVEPGMNLLECMVGEDDIKYAKENYVRAMKGESFITVQEYGETDRSYYETFYNPIRNEKNEIVGATAFARNITERKKAELALKESEEKFRNLFEHSPVGKSMTGIDGSINVNKSFCDLLGYTSDELKSKNWKEISRAEDIPMTENLVKELISGKRDFVRFEKGYIHKNGSTVFTDVATYLQRDNSGNPEYFITTINDITDRKLAESKLLASQERYSLVISASEQGIWDWNVETNDVFFSEQWKRQIGYADHEIENIFDSWINLLHPDDKESCLLAVQSYLNNPAEHFILEFRFLHKDGSYRIIHNKSASVKNADGRVIRMFGTHTDITDQKKAEEEIIKTGQHYQALIEKAPDGIALIDAEGNFKYISPSAKKMFGYIQTDEISGNPAEYTHPDDLPMVLSELGKIFEDPAYVPTLQYRFVDKLGHWHWVEATFSNLLANPSVESIVLNFRDITERKQLDKVNTFLSTSGYSGSDENFFESLAKYLSEILESEYVCIDKLEGDGLTAQTVAIYNEGKFDPNVSYTLKQTPCGDVVGKTICCFPENVCQLFPHDDVLQDLKAHSYIGTTLWSFDGKPIGLIAIIGQKPLKNAAFAENILKLVAIRAAGELERMQAEEEIKKLNESLEQRVADRIAQLRTVNNELEAFSYSVSHDLRAPLRAIHSFTSILKEDYKAVLDDEGKRICGIIESSSVHMGRLIDDLLAFSRVGRAEIQHIKIDMNIIVKDVANDLLTAYDKKRISIKVDKLPFASGDLSTMKQVWINLISNAVKYSANNESPEITIGYGKDKNNNVYFIKDNGAGFDMQYVDKLFRVFQRLHSAKEFDGNGVGLAIVHRIITKHGGTVWAEGEVGKGATFYFTLPEK